MLTRMDRFEVLLLLARPAAGKSEVIDYLRRLPPESGRARFHVGDLRVLDDFPMLWAWFEEDALLQRMGLPRLHTDESGYFLRRELWDLLIRRLCLEYGKMLDDEPGLHERSTVVLEFSRGSEHGGYRAALAAMDPAILRRAAALWINVSWEESLRKNRLRYNPRRPHSILEHALPDDKMERLYRRTDWAELTASDPGYVRVGDVRLPYAVMPNEDDVTTGRGEALGTRLEASCARLWDLYTKR